MPGQGQDICNGPLPFPLLPFPPLPFPPLPHSDSDITKERVQKILGAGANVVLTTGGIDDLCLKYFVEAGAMAVRRCTKEVLKRSRRLTPPSWDRPTRWSRRVCVTMNSF